MPSAPASKIAEKRATRSSSRDELNEAKPAADRLQGGMEKEQVLSYIRLVFELLVETRAEIKEMSKRSVDLLAKIQKSSEENLSLKQKLYDSPVPCEKYEQ